MKQSRPLWIFLLLCCATAAIAASHPQAERELLAADAARTEAMVAADTATLERVLADDLSYGHSNGRVQGKKELLESLQTGALRYRALTTDETVARGYGCAGVVTGKAAAEVESAGQTASLTLRYTATYARQRGHWVLVAYQSVKLP
jgi:hypothetical protein